MTAAAAVTAGADVVDAVIVADTVTVTAVDAAVIVVDAAAAGATSFRSAQQWR